MIGTLYSAGTTASSRPSLDYNPLAPTEVTDFDGLRARAILGHGSSVAADERHVVNVAVMDAFDERADLGAPE